MNVATLILSGGQSTRMGTDKGLLRYQHKTWVGHLVGMVENFSEVYISVGPHNLCSYQNEGLKNLVLDGDFKDLCGPIKGFRSALPALKGFDGILVIPCDMIGLNPPLLESMVLFGESTFYQANQHSFPLPFFIHSEDYSYFEQGDFENKSLKSILFGLIKNKIQTTDYQSFKNINTPDDL